MTGEGEDALRRRARDQLAGWPVSSLLASSELLEAGRRDPETLHLAISALLRLGRREQALPLMEELLALTPADVGLLGELVACHKARADLSALRRLWDRVGELPRRRLDVLLLQIRLCNLLDEHRLAGELCELLLQRRPEEPEYWCMYAWHRQSCGELEEAARGYRSALQLDPDHTRAHFALAQVLQATPDRRDHLDATLASLRRRPDAPPAERASLHYALGKGYEDCGDYPAAFEQFRAGATAIRGSLRYDAALDTRVMQSAAEWARASLTAGPVTGHPDPAPIFILGMPRTGSTLLDRALSCHPRVHAAGELLCLRAAARGEFSGLPGIDSFRQLFADPAQALDFAAVGRRYLELAGGARDPDLPRFTDKLPLNYFFLGLIALALPRARILHTTRNPMDTCFSLYKQLFGDDFYNFSYDLEELAEHYAAYSRLMDRWHALFPGRILDVPYEQLVADPLATLQQALAHCELPWDPACLQPELNPAPVDTASAAQVQRPIHAGAVGRWRRYRKQLAPLARALAARGIETGDEAPE